MAKIHFWASVDWHVTMGFGHINKLILHARAYRTSSYLGQETEEKRETQVIGFVRKNNIC